MSKRIAFFDFDGTITSKDTLLEIIKYKHGSLKFYLGFLFSSPWVVAYKLRIISNQRAKERVMKLFFGKMLLPDFQEFCSEFSLNVIPSLIRPKALEEIQQLKDAGAEIVIVSASAENWIRDWCNQMQLKLVATHLMVKDNRVTGKINGKNCYGEEKVRRIKADFDLSQFNEIYCYGDSSGDKPMLSLGTIAFYKPFQSQKF